MEEAPNLSTPASYIFDHDDATASTVTSERLSDELLFITYEIESTVAEIRQAQYQRIALQFPDNLLQDAPRVVRALSGGTRSTYRESTSTSSEEPVSKQVSTSRPRFYILGDTSYGACCVDEIAAEHVDADAVIHYGRACLSPTSRLPIIYVFTKQPLYTPKQLYSDFADIYPDKGQKVILMADVTYQYLLHDIVTSLQGQGYSNLFETEVQHAPSSLLPNRTVPEDVRVETHTLGQWDLFHISEPPQSLLLALSSRVASIHIYPTEAESLFASERTSPVISTRMLSRRYALLTSVSTVSVFGILINTLSLKNYLHIVEHVKARIIAAGKKSYTFVVGKINAAKIANFSEIGAWIIIGCWESSLIDSKDFWKPIVTPFELELALQKDDERLWTGQWSSDFQQVLDSPLRSCSQDQRSTSPKPENQESALDGELDTEPESLPPEFDLRSGRYISHSRPMHSSGVGKGKPGPATASTALSKRHKSDVVLMAGNSPGAEFLQSKRTWKGLGSDFEIAYENPGTAIEEGRSGIARGYTHYGTSSAV
ncbi:uncharacterized protein KY384_002001 [Bacidia gigantensis]|uniref:uncharacterized protein n=1 Tax=Bacidia gigantensis TaxID=2732470 RepID=UPI001D05A9F2|nr:uncharacterized protein KY384_002001 [Bacidia gigantensis]KAG8533218.1 hypothetical protein KY384_002001 [Bacidia gigantensis]